MWFSSDENETGDSAESLERVLGRDAMLGYPDSSHILTGRALDIFNREVIE